MKRLSQLDLALKGPVLTNHILKHNLYAKMAIPDSQWYP